MAEVTAQATTGARRPLRAAELAALRAAGAGDVVGPDDPAYDDGRRVWNASCDRRPAAIVRPRMARDVAAAIRFAREHDLALTVRGGGHGAVGDGSIDDGLEIDLSELRQVTGDADRRRASAGGGAFLSQLDAAAQGHGLVCPVGVVGHTGVGGLTLGGGNGRLQRRFGMTIDSLVGVELVTADGRTLYASETDEPDLFWAIRGAGANFGVVTRFDFELHPFDGRLGRGLRMFDGRHAWTVWTAFRAFADVAAEELNVSFTIGRGLPEADFPPEVAGGPVVFVGYNHCGEPDEHDAAIGPFAVDAEPFASSRGVATYLEVQAMNDEYMGWGHRSFIRGMFANDYRRETIEAIVERAASAPSEASFSVSMLGGAIGRVAPEATSYPGRTARFDITADSMWDDPAEDRTQIAWITDVMRIAEADPGAAPGRYVNAMSEAGPEVSRSIYASGFDRLAALKRAWDPDNVFRSNQNIPPEG